MKCSDANSASRPGLPAPLAQEYTIAARTDADTADCYWFFINTGFVILDDGTMLAAGSHVVVGPGAVAADGTSDCCVIIARSMDHGRTWSEATRLPFRRRPEVALYARGKTAYLFSGFSGKGIREGVILAAASSDGGTTWMSPVTLIRGAGNAHEPGAGCRPGRWEVPTEAASTDDHWYAVNQTAVAEREGRLYMAVGEKCQTMGVAVCDLSKGLLNPAAWRLSQQVEMPIPREVDPGFFPGPAMRCLEGNVLPFGERLAADADTDKRRLRVIARAVIDRYGTSGLAAVFEVEDDGVQPKLTFTQLYPVPGGQGKFFMVYDETSRLYWMASNLPANTQGWVAAPEGLPRGNDRRTLMLWYACDALNWFPAGCIARTDHLTEAFMYPVMQIDGDDLAILVRTSKRDSGLRSEVRAVNGFHDANLMTFHRVRNFRSLAMDIRPR